MSLLFDEIAIKKMPSGLVHQFNPGVLYAYYNLGKYQYQITDDFLKIDRLQDHQIWVLNSDFDYDSIPLKKKKVTYYSLTPLPKSQEIKEFLYDLDSLFIEPDKQTRRGIGIVKRVEFLDKIDDENFLKIADAWEAHKRSDPKVFQIIFEAKRYRRSFDLDKIGFKTFNRLIKVSGQPYGIISFALDGNMAFELAFLSLYFDKSLKIINDLNECVIIRCFYELWKEGIKFINPGFDGGMKGLKIFKEKIQHTPVSYYKFRKVLTPEKNYTIIPL